MRNYLKESLDGTWLPGNIKERRERSEYMWHILKREVPGSFAQQ